MVPYHSKGNNAQVVQTYESTDVGVQLEGHKFKDRSVMFK